MSGKATLRCVGFRPHCSGSLHGFADVAFVDLRLVVRRVAIHTKDKGPWALPPAQAWVKHGETVRRERPANLRPSAP